MKSNQIKLKIDGKEVYIDAEELNKALKDNEKFISRNTRVIDAMAEFIILRCTKKSDAQEIAILPQIIELYWKIIFHQ